MRSSAVGMREDPFAQRLGETWRSLRGFLVVGMAFFAAQHLYLWRRLVEGAGVDATVASALAWLAGVVALGMPLAVFASRLVAPRDARWWITPVYLWIGMSTLLLLSAGVVDVARLVLGAPWTPVCALIAAALGFGASAWAIREGRRVRVKRVEVPLGKLPAALDGLRLAQLSDLHVGPTIDRGFVEDVVAKVNALSPDVIVITGDLVDGRVHELEHDIAPLARLRAVHGTYFVTGNHEYHAGADDWCAHLRRLGIRVLRNERVELRRGHHALHLAGIDDEGADLAAALSGRDESAPLILLAHQPKEVHSAVRYEVDLQLSGHTHGGQLWPLRWLLRAGQPAIAGLARFGGTFLYVSCGTGFSGPPMRLGVPAEITELVLRATSLPQEHAS